MVQPVGDPNFARPAFDGAYYVDWARDLASGGSGPGGAFYLAPLYPYLLSLSFRVLGERLDLIYALQHLLALGSGGLIAVGGRRLLGDSSALAACALFLFHQPLLFFASRPMGETLALFLVLLAWVGLERPSNRGAACAGVAAGLAILVRPNFLLVVLAWCVAEFARRRPARAGLLLFATAVVVLPVTVRNFTVSGHPVLVSANGGITSYHGNGPGALGIYRHPAGMSGDVRRQREEATALASARSGTALDAVAADRWWGQRAFAERTGDPLGTFRLLVRRCALVVGNHEYGLDYPPLLDANPFRPALRFGAASDLPWVPFALLLGLAVGGLILRGPGGSGGIALWLAVAACLATPLLFYVSSRYRLPLAALLTLPAGVGLTQLATALKPPVARRTRLAVGLALFFVLISVLVRFPSLEVEDRAGGLSNRALAHQRIGEFEPALHDARRAIELSPTGRAWFVLGVIEQARERGTAAESAYREALLRDPGMADAASRLGLLLRHAGRPREAIEPLESALAWRPSHTDAWHQLIRAHVEAGETVAARRAGARARRGHRRRPRRLRSAAGGVTMKFAFWRRSAAEFRRIEDALGYRFRDSDLLAMSLTHRSHSYEAGRQRWNNYERMEFLGDALLGFVVAEWLYREDPEAPEGVLSRRRQSVVRASTLADAARRLDLGGAVRLGRGEERTGGREKQSLLADTFEAVLGAIYLDGGIRPARAFVRRHLGASLAEVHETGGSPDDYKTTLQERVQARLQRTPRYRIVSTSGPAHARRFVVEALLGERVLGRGTGTNRKSAEQQAAREALEQFDESGDAS
ncbi:MAG: ribonuclease III [bacterium]|nr:ribonuclease III [bacterium]